MRILVLGGTGFLSGSCTRAGVAAGHEVWALSRGNRPTPAGAHPIHADRHDHGAFRKAIEDAAGAVRGDGAAWDLVIDCIGFNARDAAQDVDDFASRARHLVFISTDFTIDPVDRPPIVDEHYSRFSDLPYGGGKRAAEVELMNAAGARRIAMRVTVLRPCHIYGPGSRLGCLPHHGRDPDLIEHMLAGRPLRLVGGGHFLQQPVYVDDLFTMAVSCVDRPQAAGQIYFAAGPELVESRTYYRHIAQRLGVPLVIEEASIRECLEKDPAKLPFCCHRGYAMDKARGHGLSIPATRLAEGLARHVDSLLAATDRPANA